ncbi:glycosyltransferase [Methanobrevibacter sp.]|uniref:glycosyltransferase n=1 Tax=Methanobrevibacter sp. TaxID=66852 RepID=UPI00386B2084
MSQDNPIISVLVPSLNVEDYINECMDSIINQTLENIEIICIDAGSTDNTLNILNQYSKNDSRIKILHSSKKSYGYQMNLGLTLATGEYIGIVETDDYIAENMYEELYKLTGNGTADIAKGTFYHFYDFDSDKPLEIDWSKKQLKDVKDPFTIYQQERFLDGHPSIWAGIYRRQFLIDNNIKFVEEKGGAWVDNGFFYETSCAAKKIVYRPEPYYYYREDNPNSSSNSLGDFTIPIRRMIENLEILDKYDCKDENVRLMAHIRAFDYVRNIYRRDGFEEHLDEVKPYLHEMMLMLDENLVHKLNITRQKIYYKYVSSSCLDNSTDSIEFMENVSSNYVEKINSLNKDLNDLKKRNDELISKNRALLSENNDLKHFKEDYATKCTELEDAKIKYEELNYEKNKLHDYIYDVENSKAFKIGTKLASPIRWLRSRTKNNSSKKLNVLFIPSDNNRTSGAFLSMANLILNLKEKYNINELVILPNKGNGDEILSSFGIKFILIDSKDWVVPLSQKRDDAFVKEINEKKRINNEAILKIREVINNNNFDIMHINTTYSYVGAEAAIKEKLPFVWHLREFLEEDQSNTLWDREEGNNLINKANKIIAISDSIFKKYENIFDKGRLVRIYNGIDAKKFYKPQRTIFNDEIIKFIMVGGFEYYKGQIEFAEACTKLYSSGFHNFEVSFVGTGRGDVKSKVEKIFSDAGMDNVKYLGYKQNVEDYFAESDVSFTCAKSEAFGRTTVEAMLSGNIVIGADSAGTKELIKDGETGILFEHENSQDLFEKMLLVVENIENSKKIANNGREFMSQNMTAEINADKIYALYNEVINKK